MARSRTPREPQTTEPEGAETDATDATEDGGVSISKSGAARAAMAQGYNKPEQATQYIKDHFGIDMTRQHFSAVKSQMKKKADEEKPAAKRLGRPPGKSRPVEGGPGTSRPDLANGEVDLLLALESIKPLIDQFGADRLKRMVDLIG